MEFITFEGLVGCLNAVLAEYEEEIINYEEYDERTRDLIGKVADIKCWHVRIPI